MPSPSPAPILHDITIEIRGSGTASASAASAAQGTQITLTASPASGFEFTGWRVVSGGAQITGGGFAMPGNAVTIEAIFGTPSDNPIDFIGIGDIYQDFDVPFNDIIEGRAFVMFGPKGGVLEDLDIMPGFTNVRAGLTGFGYTGELGMVVPLNSVRITLFGTFLRTLPSGTYVLAVRTVDGDILIGDDIVVDNPIVGNNILIQIQPPGSGTASANVASAVQGKPITLTASPASGFEFIGWRVVEGGAEIADGVFTMPDNAVIIEAIFGTPSENPGDFTGTGDMYQDFPVQYNDVIEGRAFVMFGRKGDVLEDLAPLPGHTDARAGLTGFGYTDELGMVVPLNSIRATVFGTFLSTLPNGIYVLAVRTVDGDIIIGEDIIVDNPENGNGNGNGDGENGNDGGTPGSGRPPRPREPGSGDGYNAIRFGSRNVNFNTPASPVINEAEPPAIPPVGELPLPPAPTFPVNRFADVSQTDWFYNHVNFVYMRDLMEGTAPNLFSPNMVLTRAMVVQVLYNLHGRPSVSGLHNPFDDVAPGNWYHDAVVWGANNDVVVGFGDGTFRPSINVTRAWVAVILDNYAQRFGMELPILRDLTPFSDHADIRNYALESVEAFYRAMVISGNPDGTFNPQGGATRAELAAILHSFFEVTGR